MDIPNLSQTPKSNNSPLTLILIPVIFIFAIASGFGLSRAFPTSSSNTQNSPTNSTVDTVSTDNLAKEDVKAGKTYGTNDTKAFPDSATGTIQKGSLNGEGTHILVRPGGDSQRAALTSSVVDLDLFVDHKVEIKGQTNKSKKVSWLLDVGYVKVLE